MEKSLIINKNFWTISAFDNLIFKWEGEYATF